MGLVKSNKANVAVGVFDKIPSQLVATHLATYKQLFVTSQSDPLAQSKRLSVSDLDCVSLTLPPSSWPHRHLLEGEFRRAGIAWNVAVEADGWDLMVHFAKLGVAPTIVNSHVRIPKGLKAIEIVDLPATEYVAITKRQPSENVVEFVKRLKLGVKPGE